MRRFIQKDPIWGDRWEPLSLNRYVYVGGNPVNWVDPSGLLNLLFGTGGSIVLAGGGEGSLGIVINPGLGDDQADIGVFGSAGGAFGLNISGDIFVGYIEGGIENVSGETLNINLLIDKVSITVFTDINTGEIVGGTFGIGPSAIPVGVSGSISSTGTFTLRDLINLIMGDDGC